MGEPTDLVLSSKDAYSTPMPVAVLPKPPEPLVTPPSPLLAPMSEIAGRMAVEVGAQHLKRPGPGRGVLLGGLPGVPPARVVIVGSGNVGKNACRAAVGAGARVTVASIDDAQLRALEELYAT